MVREQDIIAIFHSVHRVMKAEKVLKKAHLDVMLIPTPRQLSSDCGLALRYTVAAAGEVAAVLAASGLPLAAELYQYVDGDYVVFSPPPAINSLPLPDHS